MHGLGRHVISSMHLPTVTRGQPGLEEHALDPQCSVWAVLRGKNPNAGMARDTYARLAAVNTLCRRAVHSEMHRNEVRFRRRLVTGLRHCSPTPKKPANQRFSARGLLSGGVESSTVLHRPPRSPTAGCAGANWCHWHCGGRLPANRPGPMSPGLWSGVAARQKTGRFVFPRAWDAARLT
jgi:hypothetical protein